MGEQRDNQQHLDPDTPVEVRGYKTDPLRRGYQILWNYENIYWRALVGNDAWSLYEILRSYCHDRNPVCYPSINLLISILGLTDRRGLTGRKKKSNGKTYTYPGLIDTLQDHELVVAQVEGEGPTLRYIFHVNLTPGQLSQEQLEQLPEILQKKHAELLERCELAKQELEALKRPSKVQEDGEEFLEEGMGNSQGGMGNSQRGGGNFPPEHYQYNNNKKTTVVVEKIKRYDISEDKAQELILQHGLEHVEEKVEFLEWKLERRRRGKGGRGRPITDPAGWLIRAIEKDYNPPRAFFEHKEHVQEAARLDEEWEEQQQEIELDSLHQEDVLARLMEEYGTTEQEVELWREVLGELKLQMPRNTFDTWLAPSHLMTLDDGDRAVIGVANAFALEWIEQRLAPKVKRTLEGLVDGGSLELEFVVVKASEEKKE